MGTGRSRITGAEINESVKYHVGKSKQDRAMDRAEIFARDPMISTAEATQRVNERHIQRAFGEKSYPELDTSGMTASEAARALDMRMRMAAQDMAYARQYMQGSRPTAATEAEVRARQRAAAEMAIQQTQEFS
jgi:hypothetical protein